MRYFTFWRRLGAGFLDGLVFVPLGLIDRYFAAPERGPVLLILWAVIAYSAGWIYSVLLHARYGQTLGKMAARVQVLDVAEARIPTLNQAFLRDIGYVVLSCAGLAYFIYLVVTRSYSPARAASGTPALIVAYLNLGWFLLEVFTMLTNSKRRALHDLIARTVVVREN